MMNRHCTPFWLRTTLALVSLAAGCWCLLPAAANAQLREPPQLADVTRRLLDDARDGRLDQFDLPAAALVASGVEDECELAHWLGDYYEKRAGVLSLALATLPDDRLAALHRAMHERLLIGRYRSTASDLRLLLVRGEYNCLSAAVVFADICREANIELDCWLQPGHVYLCPTAGDALPHAARRIEPASKRWRPKLAKEDGPPGGKSTAGQGIESRRLNAAELLAKIYYNRGLVRLAAHDYEAGLSLLHISRILDPADPDARHNLVAGLNNWAVECCHQRQYPAAARLIEQGLEIERFYEPLRTNRRLIEQLLAGRILAE